MEEKVCSVTENLVTDPPYADYHGWKVATIACASLNAVLLTAVIALTVIVIKVFQIALFLQLEIVYMHAQVTHTYIYKCIYTYTHV